MEQKCNQKRIGYLSMPYRLIKGSDLLKEAFFKLDIWVVDVRYDQGYINKYYTIASKYLDEVNDGEVIPEYIIEISFGEENSYSLRRVQD